MSDDKEVKVSVTASENFNGVMILINAEIANSITEEEHFFERIGREVDAIYFKEE